MDYDFTTLSPEDFENLVSDLLSSEWGAQLESYKEGKDGGVDLQNSRLIKGQVLTIIQCKRYKPDDFAQLKRSIKNELEKLQKIKPERYILATSTKLSLANKRALMKLLDPWIQDTADIYGPRELNGMLRRHEAIQKAHFKLWMSSTVALERILHSRIFNVTEDTVEGVKHQLCRLVIHDAFDRALSTLQAHHYCVIAGNPGIGKTTLAKMLLCHYMQQGFEPLVVVGNIEDAWTATTKSKVPNEKIVICYDDFLGRYRFDQLKFAKNEDALLLQFIEKVRASPNLRFVLTTREYFIASAKSHHGAFEQAADSLQSCVIQLDDYKRIHRAKVLFNHLYFSDLSDERLSLLVENRVYLDIINHENFVPRTVEAISNQANSYSLSDEDFLIFVRKKFDDPSELWDHAFRHEISPFSRQILVLLWSFSGSVEFDILKEAALNIEVNNSLDGTIKFQDSMKELSSNFISMDSYPYSYPPSSRATIIGFQNPSIEEYVDRSICGEEIWIDMLVRSTTYFHQVIRLYSWGTEHLADNTFKNTRKLFWLKLNERAIQAENSTIGYIYKSQSNGYCYTNSDRETSLDRTLTLLQISENIEKYDAHFIDISKRFTTKEGWLLLIKDLPFNGLISYGLSPVLTWMIQSKFWHPYLDLSIEKFSEAVHEILEIDDDWTIGYAVFRLLERSLDQIKFDFTSEELCKFHSVAEAIANEAIEDEDDPDRIDEVASMLDKYRFRSGQGDESLILDLKVRAQRLRQSNDDEDTSSADIADYKSDVVKENELNLDAMFAALINR